MQKRFATRIPCPFILLILALILGAQSATWGQTAVSCSALSDWSASSAWGLQIPCYPDEGVCFEDTWFVTVQPSCFLNLAISPSITTFTLRGSIFADNQTRDISVSGTTSLEGGGIFNAGTLFASGPLDISDAFVSLSGTNLQSSSTATMSGNSSVSSFGVFQNDGDFHKVGVGTTSGISGVFNSPGTIDVESGTLILSGGGVASNDVSVHTGAVLEFGGSYGITGSLASDGTVRVNKNTAVVDSTGSWNTDSTEILEGELNFVSGSSRLVTMTFGTLTGDLNVWGHLEWTGGTMKAPGTTWITSSADVTDDFLDPKLDGRRLEVETGAILNVWRLPASVAGNGIWGVNGASIHNRGTVNVVEGVPLFAASSADASFENDGLFAKTGPNTATLQFEFFNHGTVHVTDGELDFDHYVQSVNPTTLTDPVIQLTGGGSMGDTGALIDIQDGYLQGNGAVDPAVQCTGVISPGVDSMGFLNFGSTLTLGPGAALELELSGAAGAPGVDHDSIGVSDSLVLDGDLLVTFANGFESVVQPGDSFDLATVQSVAAIQGQLVGQPSGSQLFTADGFGSFTVEYGPGSTVPSVLRLVNYQPATPNPAGSVPDGDDVPGLPLRIDKATGTDITLTWDSSCATGDTDYEIYQGEIGDYYSHVKMDPCSTGGATTATFAPLASVSTYYLVVPANGTSEGSYGLMSDGTERPQPLHPADRCKPQQIAAVCP